MCRRRTPFLRIFFLATEATENSSRRLPRYINNFRFEGIAVANLHPFSRIFVHFFLHNFSPPFLRWLKQTTILLSSSSPPYPVVKDELRWSGWQVVSGKPARESKVYNSDYLYMLLIFIVLANLNCFGLLILLCFFILMNNPL